MVKFVNKTTGGEMWVAESRKEEYLAAGFLIAAEPSPEKDAQKKPKRGTRKTKKVE